MPFEKDVLFWVIINLYFLLSILMFSKKRYLALIGWIFAFTVFDILGFEYTDVRRGSFDYRIIQSMFHIAISYILYLKFDWKMVVSANLMWWFWVCDILFYFPMRYVFTPISWSLWSPVSFVTNVMFGIPAPTWAMFAGAVLSVISVFIINKKNKSV